MALLVKHRRPTPLEEQFAFFKRKFMELDPDHGWCSLSSPLGGVEPNYSVMATRDGQSLVGAVSDVAKAIGVNPSSVYSAVLKGRLTKGWKVVRL